MNTAKSKQERNKKIFAEYQDSNLSMYQLALKFKLTPQRIQQIIREEGAKA